MAKAKNMVIEGDFKGKVVMKGSLGRPPYITGGLRTYATLDKASVKEYEVMDSESRKSGTSAVGRAAVGAFFLGPVGLLAGISAKTKGIHLVAVEFKSGERSLIEIDEKIYKDLIKALF